MHRDEESPPRGRRSAIPRTTRAVLQCHGRARVAASRARHNCRTPKPKTSQDGDLAGVGMWACSRSECLYSRNFAGREACYRCGAQRRVEHSPFGVSRLSPNVPELNALMFAVRVISVAVQLEKEVFGRLIRQRQQVRSGDHAVPDVGPDQPRPGTAGMAVELGCEGRASEKVQACACGGQRNCRRGCRVGPRVCHGSGRAILRRRRESRSPSTMLTSGRICLVGLTRRRVKTEFGLWTIVGWSSALARPMFALFLLRQTSLKYIPFVEGCLPMHFAKSTSMFWVYKRRARAVPFLGVCVVVLTWSPRLPCLGREGWVRNCLCVAGDILVLHARISVIRVSIRNSPFLICSAHARCEPRDAREEAASMEWSLVTWWSSITRKVNLSSCASTAVRGL